MINDPFFTDGRKKSDREWEESQREWDKTYGKWKAERDAERKDNSERAKNTFLLFLVLPVAVIGFYCLCGLIVFCILVYKNQTASRGQALNRTPAVPPPAQPMTPLAAAGGQPPPLPPPPQYPGYPPPPYPVYPADPV